MKDFRTQVVQRIPELTEEIDNLLSKGQLRKALRKAKSAGFCITQDKINSTAHAMYNGGRAGELLSMVGVVEVKLPYDEVSLLIRTFEKRDYHGFLKHAHRLRVRNGIEEQIKKAIENIELRAPNEATSWRQKFS